MSSADLLPLGTRLAKLFWLWADIPNPQEET